MQKSLEEVQAMAIGVIITMAGSTRSDPDCSLYNHCEVGIQHRACVIGEAGNSTVD